MVIFRQLALFFSEVRVTVSTDMSVHSIVIKPWHKITFLTLLFSFVATTVSGFIRYRIDRYNVDFIYGRLNYLETENTQLESRFNSMHSELLQISRYISSVGSGKSNDQDISNQLSSLDNSHLPNIDPTDIKQTASVVSNTIDSMNALLKKINARICILSEMIHKSGIEFRVVQKIRNFVSLKRKSGDTNIYYISTGIFNQDRGDDIKERIDDAIELESIAHHLPIRAPMTGYRVTSRFGSRSDPFHHHTAFHRGLDISGGPDAKVISTGAGVVHYAGRDAVYGNFVDINHGYSIITRYAHMKQSVVKKGEYIKPGQLVGYQGHSGRALGDHLHYEVRHRGVAINPTKFITAGSYVQTLSTKQKR